LEQKEEKMNTERVGIFKFRGLDMTIIGDDLKSGDNAPEFQVQSIDWTVIHGLEKTKGKVRIIMSLPSLSTDVCDRETRRFNEEATHLNDDIVILAISADLPFTQKSWCSGAGIDRVITLSDHLDGDFGSKYGCYLKEIGILRRAVFVVDRDDKIVYSAYMPVLGEEPNYNEVLDAAKSAL
jgi:thiol peroxidase